LFSKITPDWKTNSKSNFNEDKQMTKQYFLRLSATSLFLFTAILFHANTVFGQHPCDNYPVTVCNVPSSFATWTVQDNNNVATQQVGEPFVVFPNPMKSLWYAWIAPATGTVVANTRGTNPNSTFFLDTELAVYRETGSGGTFTSLHQIIANDDWSNASPYSINLEAPRPPDEVQNSSCVLFAATAGETYFFQVDGYGNFLGPFFLNLYYLAPSSAEVSVSGRVLSSDGGAVSKVRVMLTKPNGETVSATTNTFGYYHFGELEAGQTYILEVQSKKYQFQNNPRVLTVSDDVQNEDFITANDFFNKRE